MTGPERSFSGSFSRASSFLHSIEVMHRDIKPLNMTVVSTNPDRSQARLIDFGLAMRGLESNQYRIGTKSYLAPEVLAGLDGRSYDAYRERVGVFAFGLSMYQFLCRQPLAWDRIDRDVNGNINQGAQFRTVQIWTDGLD